ncbi:hypothetical protein D9M72_278330 [compost metagenome]
MRGLRAYARCHGDGTGDCAAEHAGGDDAERIGRGERDGAFGDEGRSQQPGGLAVFTLGQAETLLVQDGGGEGHGQRRNHARGHDGCHDLPRCLVVQGCGTQAGDGERVGNLVDRAAEVEAHHEAQDDAQRDGAGTGESGEPTVQALGDGYDRSAQDQEHQAGSHEGGHQRNDHHGHQAAQPAGHLDLADGMGNVAGQEAAHDAAEEACTHEPCDGACHEARCDARAVGDAVGDVAGQCGDQEAEGQGADLEEHGTEVGAERAPGVLRVFGGQVEDAVVHHDGVRELGNQVAAHQEAQGDQETAAGHKRDHVADTGEERLLQLLADVLALFGGLGFSLLLGAVVRDPAGVGVVRGGQCLLDHFVRLVNAALDRSVDDRHAGEALLAADVHVHREDHGVSGCDHRGVQRLGAGGALGFHLQVHSDFLGSCHEGVGGHVGVGDARGAGRHGHEALGTPGPGTGGGTGGRCCGCACPGCCACCCGFCGGRGLVGQGSFHQFNNVGLRGGCAERRGEVLLDQRAGQLGQELQMLLVRTFRGCDEEDEVRRAVLGAEVHRLREPGHGQGGHRHRSGAAVRNGNSARNAGGGFGLPGKGVREEAFRLAGASCGGNPAGQMADHVLGRVAQVLV